MNRPLALPSVLCLLCLGAAVPGASTTADMDGDAIPDSVETEDWYIAAGGAPDRVDIWVECDFMKQVGPERGYVRRHAPEVFAAAPFVGPTGAKGIALHVDFDERLPHERLLGDGTFEGLYEAVMALRSEHFDGRPFRGAEAEVMREYTHYCLFVDAITEQGTSGISFDSTDPGGGIPGDTLVVSIGGVVRHFGRHNPESRRWQVGTFIHELGHNLGLSHGGAPPAEHTTFKPNYLSVMNYHFQSGFVTVDDDGHLTRLDHWDYSRFSTNRIHEGKLAELRGVEARPEAVRLDRPGGEIPLVGLFRTCSPAWTVWFAWNEPVDYDCDGVLGADRVVVDTNRDGRLENLGRVQNDWDNLVFDGGAIGGPGAARAPARLDLSDELTLEQARRLEEELRSATPASPPRPR